MFAGSSGQQWRGSAERIAALALDMDHFGAELGKLGADVGLRDQDPGPDGPDALQRAEPRHERRRRGPLQLLYPARYLKAKFFYLRFVFQYFWVVLHLVPPPEFSL